MWKNTCGLMGCLLVTLSLYGANPPKSGTGSGAPTTMPEKSPVIREVYWQELQVRWVYVDNTGQPWLATNKGDITQNANSGIKQISAHQELLLGDRAGRAWINVKYSGRTTTKIFDGNSWHDTGFCACTAFEDSAGRVFLADRMDVRVLADGAWSKQQASPIAYGAEGHFAEDPNGRVWFWAAKDHIAPWGYFPGMRGAWCYDRGKWTNYTRDSGLPIEDVGYLIPLSNDRFLIVGTPDREYKENQCVVWSPSRGVIPAGKDFFGLKPSGLISYAGIDLDGLHHFLVKGLKSDQTDRRIRVVVSSQGEAKVLSKAEAERAWQMPVGIYENKRRIYGRLGEIPPAVPSPVGEAICRDGLGRIYFRTLMSGVVVVWPKFETPGDVIRLQIDPSGIRPIFQTRDGTIWGDHGERPYAPPGKPWLVRWDGSAWTDTPVRILPHPQWTNRMMAPWNRWWRRPVVLPGRDCVLAVVQHDVYQDMEAAGKGDQLDLFEVLRKDRQDPNGHNSKWYEAWLYYHGKWSEVARLDSLLEKRWSLLAAEYTKPSARSEWFAAQGDGNGRLWVAYDSNVSVFSREGAMQWTIPIESRASTVSHLCGLPDGRMLLCSSNLGSGALWALSVKEGKVVADVVPKPWGSAFRNIRPVAFVARDKTIWLTGGGVWRLRGNRWERRDDLAEFLFEDTDGSLWFQPGGEYRMLPHHGFRVVKGEETKTFPWPSEYPLGMLTPTLDGRLLAICDYWIIELDKADDALKRKVSKARIADHLVGRFDPAFQAKDGAVFVGCWRGKESQAATPILPVAR